MESSNKFQVNSIVWASSIDKAIEIASRFTNGEEKPNKVFTTSDDECSINTYVRSFNYFGSAAPSGITDLIIFYLPSANSPDFNEAKKYLDSRKGIPIKILTSENALLEEASSLDCKFVSLNALLGEERETILKEAKKFEETLLKCFKKFDINGNGLISVDELIKVSAELEHVLSYDDAKMIVDTLDSSKENGGNISFESFKKWWVQRKTDFMDFRRLCKAEMSINNIIKLTSKHFNDYLTNLKGEGNTLSEQKSSQDININIHSCPEFENGLGIFGELFRGAEAKEIIESKPDKMKDTPLGFSFKIHLSSNEAAEKLAAFLSKEIPLIESFMIKIEPLTSLGLSYYFRAAGSDVLCEVYAQGMIAIIIQDVSSQFLPNLADINISSSITFHFFTTLTLQILLRTTGFEFVKNILQFKFHLISKSVNLRTALLALCDLLEKQIESQTLPSSFKNNIMIIRSLIALRKFDFDLSFDHPDLINKIIDSQASQILRSSTGNNLTFEQAKKQAIEDDSLDFSYKFAYIKEIIYKFKSITTEEYLPVVNSLDLNKVEFEGFFNHPQASFLLKVNLHLADMNALVKGIYSQ